MPDENVIQPKSYLVRYNEVSDNQLSREPFTPGALYITNTGKFAFDSPIHESRMFLNGVTCVTESDVVDFNNLTLSADIVVENVNCDHSPLQAKGLLSVRPGTNNIIQTFTSIGGLFYIRSGSIALGVVDWGNWTQVGGAS